MQQSGGKVEQAGLWTVSTTASVGATSTRTTITPSLSSQTLIASNTGRKGLRVIHTPVDPTQICWISTGTASSTSFFTKQKGAWEIELFDAAYPYTGAYTLISDVASGTTQVFELTT